MGAFRQILQKKIKAAFSTRAKIKFNHSIKIKMSFSSNEAIKNIILQMTSNRSIKTFYYVASASLVGH
jgi:hypothetical protein